LNRSHPALRKSVQFRTVQRKSQTPHATCCQALGIPGSPALANAPTIRS
jgi:hypothetical protein